MAKTFLEKIKEFYGLTDEEYAFLSRPINNDNIKSYNDFIDMEKASLRVIKAIDNKEKILVYGDYDCDGIMSTSILIKALYILGGNKNTIGFFIPSRYVDGYGLNSKMVEAFSKKDYKLIITVDNGISAFEAIDKANELGIDVIVSDHHQVQEKLPNAFAILHPLVSKYDDIYCSGGVVSFLLASKLLKRYDEYLLSLAGISLVSDMMVLKGNNRNILRLALTAMNKNHYLPISLLAHDQDINEGVISSQIAPKVNAVGRMVEGIEANRLVNYFTSENQEEIKKIYSFIESLNDERKNLTRESSDEIKDIDQNAPAIILSTNLKEGLIGLIANRLLNQYQKPVVIFTEDSNDSTLIKGSVRSKEGFDVSKAFQGLDRFLVHGGGHALAGGLTIKKSDFEEFKNAFYEIASKHLIEEKISKVIEINLSDINEENYNTLRTFSPFGVGFEEPTFLIKQVPTKALKFVSQGKHICTNLTLKTKLLGFNMPKDTILPLNYINLIGKIDTSSYKGNKTTDFKILIYNVEK